MRKVVRMLVVLSVLVGLGASSAPAQAIRQGEVLQVMNSNGYTYLLVRESSGKKFWTATIEKPVGVKDVVEFYDSPPMKNFQSKTLGKHFKEIIFTPELRVVWSRRLPAPAPAQAPQRAEELDAPAAPIAPAAPALEIPATPAVPAAPPVSNDYTPHFKETMRSSFKISLPAFEDLLLFSDEQSFAAYADPSSWCMVVKSYDNGAYTLSRYCSKGWEGEPFYISGTSIGQTGFSKDGKLCAVSRFDYGGDDNGITIYDAKTMKTVQELDYSSRYDKIAFNQRAEKFAAAGEKGIVNIYSTRSWEEIAILSHDEKINEVIFSPDDEYLVVAAGNVLHIYDTAKWQEVMKLEYHDIAWPKFDQNTSYLMVWTSGGYLTIYSPNWTKIFSSPNFYVDHYNLSPDGRYLALTTDSTLLFYDTRSWKEVSRFDAAGTIGRSFFSADGRFIAAGREPTTIIATESWEEVAVIDGIYYPVSGNLLSGSFLINSSYPLKIYDATPFFLSYLITDLKLHKSGKVEPLLAEWRKLEQNLKERLKLAESEHNKRIALLAGADKSEFETVAEYTARMKTRDAELREYNDQLAEQKLAIRREAAERRKAIASSCEDELFKILESDKTSAKNLKVSLEYYNAETETFPVTISTEGRRSNKPEQAVTWQGTIKVTRDKARAFKEGIAGFQASGEILTERTGRKKLANITLKNGATGEQYLLAQRKVSSPQPAQDDKKRESSAAETTAAAPAPAAKQ